MGLASTATFSIRSFNALFSIASGVSYASNSSTILASSECSLIKSVAFLAFPAIARIVSCSSRVFFRPTRSRSVTLEAFSLAIKVLATSTSPPSSSTFRKNVESLASSVRSCSSSRAFSSLLTVSLEPSIVFVSFVSSPLMRPPSSCSRLSQLACVYVFSF